MRAMTIPQLIDGAEKALVNAQEFIAEAELLLEHKRHVRAFTLAYFACEEIVKTMILYPLALYIAGGGNVDWREVGKALHRHESKIRTIGFADFLLTPREGFDNAIVDLAARLRASQDFGEKKNASLYVSATETGFVSPLDAITLEEAEACVHEARKALTYAELQKTSFQFITGSTEAGLKAVTSQPEYESFVQKLNGTLGPLDAPPETDQAKMSAALSNFFSDPEFQGLIEVYARAVEQYLDETSSAG